MSKGLTKELMALRCIRELEEGAYVNLGAGIPQLVGLFSAEKALILQGENGVLGYGSIIEKKEDADPDLTDAQGHPVSPGRGISCFDLCTSFIMIRGGRLDASILGAYQVSEKGDLANSARGSRFYMFGGAMDLAFGAKRIIVLMEHTTDSGEPKILKECAYPLTARRAVGTIITNLAFLTITPEGMVIEETAPGVTVEQVQEATEPELRVSPDLKEMEI